MTSQISSHRVFCTDIPCSCAHIKIKIDEKSSLTDGLECDLMIFIDSRLHFGVTMHGMIQI